MGTLTQLCDEKWLECMQKMVQNVKWAHKSAENMIQMIKKAEPDREERYLDHISD